MKNSIIGAFLVGLFCTSSAISEETFNASQHLSLERCWNKALQGQLACIEAEYQSCDQAADASGAPTSLGRYDCGYRIFEDTDRQLNSLYPEIIARAKSADSSGDLGVLDISREEMVRSAQRQWLQYRDETCEVIPNWFMIGPGADSLWAICAANLTVMQINILRRYVP